MDEKRHKTMIHEEICTYEVCKLAKEKGFPQLGIDSNDYWFEDNNDKLIDMNVNAFIFDVIPKEGLTRKIPQNLLQRWLREVRGIQIYIDSDLDFNDETFVYEWQIANKENFDNGGFEIHRYNSEESRSTYELALEDALKYTLENLV